MFNWLKIFLPKTDFDIWFEKTKTIIRTILEKYPFSQQTKTNVFAILKLEQDRIKYAFNKNRDSKYEKRSMASIIVDTTLKNIRWYDSKEQRIDSQGEKFLTELYRELALQEELSFYYEE